MEKRNKQFRLIPALALLLLLVIATFAEPVGAAEDTKVHFLCVTGNKGEDAILLESDGRFGFVDCGYWKSGEQILECIEELGVTKDNLEFIIGTHAHADHIGFLNDLLDTYRPERIYLMPFDSSCLTDPAQWKDKSWANAMQKADRLGIPVIDTFSEGAGERPWILKKRSNRYTASPHFSFGQAEIDIYNYSQSYRTQKVENANDTSLVVKVTAGGHTALITGDLSNAPGIGTDPGYDETAIAEEVGHVDVLKLPHHGYRWSDTNAPQDLQMFSPQWFIQTGSTDMLDYQYDNAETMNEILEECNNGSRYAATAWYDKKLIGRDGLPAITLDMGTLESNLSDKVTIAAVDKDGHVHCFTAGSLEKQMPFGNTVYFSNGKKNTSNEEHFAKCASGIYALNRDNRILSGKVRIKETTYLCLPEYGVCSRISQEKGLQDTSMNPEMMLNPLEIAPLEPDVTEGVYPRWDQDGMLEKLNAYRADNGLPALNLKADNDYAKKRAVEYEQNDTVMRKDEVVIPSYLSLSVDDAMSRTAGSAQYRNVYLGDYEEVEMTCYVYPWADAYATVYVMEFYSADGANIGEIDEQSELPPVISSGEKDTESETVSSVEGPDEITEPATDTQDGNEAVTESAGEAGDATVDVPQEADIPNDVEEQQTEEGEPCVNEQASDPEELSHLLRENNRLLSRLIALLEELLNTHFL